MKGLMHPELLSGGGGDMVKMVRRPGWKCRVEKILSQSRTCAHILCENSC